jgi:hypothetical protein
MEGSKMPNMQEIIKQLQQELRCPVCGNKFEMENIKIRGMIDKTVVVQAICRNSHPTLFITSFHEKPENQTITSDNLLDLHNALTDFDGDFIKLWSNKT